MNAPPPARLRAPGPGLWSADHDLLMPGGLNFGTRTTLLRLPSGGLAVHAPGPLDDALKDEIQALGAPEILLAPNLYHHLSLGAWAAAFPEARVLAPPGLREKIPGVPPHERLAPEGELSPDIAWQMVGGMPKLNEIAVLHRPTGTLLMTDLCFHFVDHPQWLLRASMGLMGAYGALRTTPYERYLMKDRAAVRASMDRVLGWDFSRVSMCHGRVVEAEGRERLAEAFAFLRK